MTKKLSIPIFLHLPFEKGRDLEAVLPFVKGRQRGFSRKVDGKPRRKRSQRQ
jgi:hypothetical protein